MGVELGGTCCEGAGGFDGRGPYLLRGGRGEGCGLAVGEF